MAVDELGTTIGWREAGGCIVLEYVQRRREGFVVLACVRGLCFGWRTWLICGGGDGGHTIRTPGQVEDHLKARHGRLLA